MDDKKHLFATVVEPVNTEIKEKKRGTKYKLNDKLKYDLNTTRIQFKYNSNITQTS